MLGTKCTRKTAELPTVRVSQQEADQIRKHATSWGETASDFIRRAIREAMANDRRKQADRAARIVGARAKAEGLFIECKANV